MLSRGQLMRNIWDDPWENMDRRSRLFDQFFGDVVPFDSSDYFLDDVYRGCRQDPHHWVRHAPRRLPQHSGTSEVENGEKEFRVRLDVRHFAQEDLEVKLVGQDRVRIHAKHDDRADTHGYITREFTRHYVLPKDVDATKMVVSFSPDGVLTMRVPKMALPPPGERLIPIQAEPAAENGDKGVQVEKEEAK